MWRATGPAFFGHLPWPLRSVVPNFGDRTISVISGETPKPAVSATLPGDEEAYGVNYSPLEPDLAFVMNRVRQFGAANVYHAYTVGLSDNAVEKLRNRPVYESPYMPDTTTSTTAPEGQAVVGDFSNFVIARAGGMSVELIPQLFQQVTAGSGPAVPTGQRGWFAYARIGSNSVNDLAFRLLVNS